MELKGGKWITLIARVVLDTLLEMLLGLKFKTMAGEKELKRSLQMKCIESREFAKLRISKS